MLQPISDPECGSADAMAKGYTMPVGLSRGAIIPRVLSHRMLKDTAFLAVLDHPTSP